MYQLQQFIRAGEQYVETLKHFKSFAAHVEEAIASDKIPTLKLIEANEASLKFRLFGVDHVLWFNFDPFPPSREMALRTPTATVTLYKVDALDDDKLIAHRSAVLDYKGYLYVGKPAEAIDVGDLRTVEAREAAASAFLYLLNPVWTGYEGVSL